MAIGDHVGACTSVVITCRVLDGPEQEAPVNAGDAVVLLDSPLVVGHAQKRGTPVFGQAMHDALPGEKVDVKVRGLCGLRFLRAHATPEVGPGVLYRGVVCAGPEHPGLVRPGIWITGNTTVAVDLEAGTCTVLL